MVISDSLQPDERDQINTLASASGLGKKTIVIRLIRESLRRRNTFAVNKVPPRARKARRGGV